MFVRTEGEAATTPDWRMKEGAPYGTTRKRWAKWISPTQQSKSGVWKGSPCLIKEFLRWCLEAHVFVFLADASSTGLIFPHLSLPSFLLSQLLSEIEEHLKCTITQCDTDIKVPVDEFDGKVTYGQRRVLGGICHHLRLYRSDKYLPLCSFLPTSLLSFRRRKL